MSGELLERWLLPAHIGTGSGRYFPFVFRWRHFVLSYRSYTQTMFIAICVDLIVSSAEGFKCDRYIRSDTQAFSNKMIPAGEFALIRSTPGGAMKPHCALVQALFCLGTNYFWIHSSYLIDRGHWKSDNILIGESRHKPLKPV